MSKELSYQITLNRIKVAFFNFLLVAVLGVLLRFYLVQPIEGINYRYLIHAHSHLAFLGWVFMALFALLVYAFLPHHLSTDRKYTILFLSLQLANFGMLFTFPFTGYALWSIIFSSLHAVVSIVFAVIYIKEIKRHYQPKNQVTYLFIKWSLILMIISNAGPFALGPVMAKGLGYSDIYYLLIYFYLHFQYNGWFTFAILGLLFWYIQEKGIRLDTNKLKLIFYFNLVAVFPAYVLSALWLKPGEIWYVIGAWAAFLQISANFVLLLLLWNCRKPWSNWLIEGKALMLITVASFTVKNLLQLLSSVPYLAEFALGNRNTIIAYLHLVLIGFVTFAILFLILKMGYFRSGLRLQIGLLMLIFGFIISELILILPDYNRLSLIILLTMAFIQLAGIGFMARSFNYDSFSIRKL